MDNMDKKESRLDKFHIYTSLLSGIVITLVCIIKQFSIYTSCITIICVMIIFLIIGSIAKIFLNKMFENEETNMDDEFENFENNESADDIDNYNNDEKI